MTGKSNNYKVCFDCSKPIAGGPSSSPPPSSGPATTTTESQCAQALTMGSFPNPYVWKFVYSNGPSGSGSFTQKGYGWQAGGTAYNSTGKQSKCSSSCQEVRLRIRMLICEAL